MNFPASFVCRSKQFNTIEQHISAPLFRKRFFAEAPAGKAELMICGLGFYRLFFNGEEITKGILAPYISNPDDIVYYDSYDLSDRIRKGENVIGIWLGNGMQNADGGRIWDFDLASFRSSPKTAFCAQWEEQGGIIFRCDSAKGVKTADSACSYDDLRCGCLYDARLEQPGWCDPGFDDSDWDAALPADAPKGEKRICAAEPILPYAQTKPVSVRRGSLAGYYKMCGDFRMGTPQETPPEPDGLIFDFGTNSAGLFRMRLSGAAPGTKLSFQCAERLNDAGEVDHYNLFYYPDGYAQRDIYLCRGGNEEFVPFFTYHGFRYLFVSGLPEELEKSLEITRIECSSAMDTAGSFRCSDDIFNQIEELTIRSDRSNFYYFPTDCPHREKNGWTGDAAVSNDQFLYHFRAEHSLAEWLRNIGAAQTPAGALPGIIPTGGWGFAWGNGPAWDRALTVLTEGIYDFTGDPAILFENAGAIERYVRYLVSRKNARGLYAFGLGDWLQPGCTPGEPETPLEVTDSVVAYSIFTSAARILALAGHHSGSEYAKAEASELLHCIRTKLLNADGCSALCETETAQAICLFFGIFEPKNQKSAAEELVRRIHAANDRISTGEVGISALFFALSDAGYEDLAYQLIVGPQPSYGHIVRSGLTALPESLDFYNRVRGGSIPGEGINSFNHHYLGCVTAWFYGGICGIRFSAGAVDLSPCFPAALEFAKAECRGIRSRWQREEGCIVLSVEADHENNGTIRLPEGFRFDTGEKALPFAPGEYRILPEA